MDSGQNPVDYRHCRDLTMFSNRKMGTYHKLMSTFIILSLLSTFSLSVSATPGKLVRIIGINSPQDGDSYTDDDNVEVNGWTYLFGGDISYDKWGVKLDYDDTGSVLSDCLPLDSNKDWTSDPSNNHYYTTGGTKTITAYLF